MVTGGLALKLGVLLLLRGRKGEVRVFGERGRLRGGLAMVLSRIESTGELEATLGMGEIAMLCPCWTGGRGGVEEGVDKWCLTSMT